LNIYFTGWEGVYSDLSHFKNIAKKVEILEPFLGEKTLLLDGSLSSGFNVKLHKFDLEFDLREGYNVDGTFYINSKWESFQYYNLPHAHFEGGTVISVSPQFFMKKIPQFMDGAFSRPYYALRGLYSTLPNEKLNTRINALRQELLIRKGYHEDSIAIRKETMIKLLENKYRKLISNQ
jgi:hypothetical protein